MTIPLAILVSFAVGWLCSESWTVRRFRISPRRVMAELAFKAFGPGNDGRQEQ